MYFYFLTLKVRFILSNNSQFMYFIKTYISKLKPMLLEIVTMVKTMVKQFFIDQI